MTDEAARLVVHRSNTARGERAVGARRLKSRGTGAA